MKVFIVTALPQFYSSFFNCGVIGKALKKGIFDIEILDLRKFTLDKHHQIDDRPYGGGPGMVLKIEPLFRAFNYAALKVLNLIDVDINKLDEEKRKEFIKNILEKYDPRSLKEKSKDILYSIRLEPWGKIFDQKKAQEFSKKKNLIIFCGRYEGLDERISEIIDEEISIGNFILTGGDTAALVILEATLRLLDGVLHNKESLKADTFSNSNLKGYPVYTRPAEYKGRKVPKELLSGDHKLIEKWRKEKKRL